MRETGQRIVERLSILDMSQSELARRVGVKQPTINHLIHGSSRGSTHLHKIARELGTSPAYLSGETDDPSPDALLPESVTSEEREWIDHLRGLPPKDRSALLHIARSMSMMAHSPMVNAPRLPFRGEEN